MQSAVKEEDALHWIIILISSTMLTKGTSCNYQWCSHSEGNAILPNSFLEKTIPLLKAGASGPINQCAYVFCSSWMPVLGPIHQKWLCQWLQSSDPGATTGPSAPSIFLKFMHTYLSAVSPMGQFAHKRSAQAHPGPARLGLMLLRKNQARPALPGHLKRGPPQPIFGLL